MKNVDMIRAKNVRLNVWQNVHHNVHQNVWLNVHQNVHQNVRQNVWLNVRQNVRLNVRQNVTQSAAIEGNSDIAKFRLPKDEITARQLLWMRGIDKNRGDVSRQVASKVPILIKQRVSADLRLNVRRDAGDLVDLAVRLRHG